jgi:hypothetical protein
VRETKDGGLLGLLQNADREPDNPAEPHPTMLGLNDLHSFITNEKEKSEVTWLAREIAPVRLL